MKLYIVYNQNTSISTSKTSHTSSKSPSKSPDLPTMPAIDPTNCSIEDIDVPKGKNSSFTLTVRDSEGQVVKEYSSNNKVEVLAVGKGIYETVRIQEQPNGSHLMSYTPSMSP